LTALLITPDDVFRSIGMANDGSIVSRENITLFLEEAQKYVEDTILGVKFYQESAGSDAVEITETYDGNGQRFMYLDHYPIVSLTTLTINGTSVTVSRVWVTAVTGRIELKTNAEVGVFDKSTPQLISIKYKHGELINSKAKNLMALVAGQMALVSVLGGSWSSVVSFSLPEMSGSLGSHYEALRVAVEKVTAQIQFIQQYARVKPQFG
jgi:hypothetical protein